MFYQRCYIYVLFKDNVPFYVGKTFDPEKRFHVHMERFGYNIEIEIIDDMYIDRRLRHKNNYLEQYWINQFTAWGFDLANISLTPKMGKRKMYSHKQ